jgi:hypothetical protein
MNLTLLSTYEDVFYLIIPQLESSILKLRATNRYWKSYINTFTEKTLKNKNVKYTVDLYEHNNFTSLIPNHERFINVAKIIFVMNYHDENYTEIITFLMNHIILKLMNNIFDKEKKRISDSYHDRYYGEIIRENNYNIDDNYNLLTTTTNTHPYYHILHLTFLIKNINILELIKIHDKGILEICKQLCKDIPLKYVVDNYLQIIGNYKNIIPKDKLDIIIDLIREFCYKRIRNPMGGGGAGGIFRLLAYGAQDNYLTGNPTITFTNVIYRKNTGEEAAAA